MSADSQELPALIDAVFEGLLGRRAGAEGIAHYTDKLADPSFTVPHFIAEVSHSLEFMRSRRLVNRGPDDPIACSTQEAMAVFEAFRRYEGPGRAGFVTNFLGGLTDVRHVNLEQLSGRVEGYPVPRNFHAGVIEWMGTLRAVLEARASFRMIELGAGWAPWCAIGHAAARQRGLSAHVTAVEGDGGHVGFIEENFGVNNIPRDDYRIVHGVVGVSDGIALFPRSKNANTVYGGAAAFSEPDQNAAFNVFVGNNQDAIEAVDRLDCFALDTLIRDEGLIDLVHCDVQGAEADIFERHIEAVSRTVKRVIVGTHSFAIDRRLVSLFPRHGWVAEGVEHCVMAEGGGQSHTIVDGAQIWLNRALR